MPAADLSRRATFLLVPAYGIGYTSPRYLSAIPIQCISIQKGHAMKDKSDKKDKTLDIKEESKRLKRIIGQVEGIRKMLDDERRLEDVLTQCKAVHSALKSVESRLLQRYLDVAIKNIAKAEKKKSKEQKIAELMDLYKPVS